LPSLFGYNLGFIVLSMLMLVSIPLILKIRKKPSQTPRDGPT
jgi:hypothetical protein